MLGIPPQSCALLAVLFLRGPQTAGELRINSDRLHKFGDILSVEAFLNELAERTEGALVVELAKAPGARETRWAHLLSGEPVIPVTTGIQPSRESGSQPSSDLDDLRARIDRLESEVASLRETIERLSR